VLPRITATAGMTLASLQAVSAALIQQEADNSTEETGNDNDDEAVADAEARAQAVAEAEALNTLRGVRSAVEVLSNATLLLDSSGESPDAYPELTASIRSVDVCGACTASLTQHMELVAAVSERCGALQLAVVEGVDRLSAALANMAENVPWLVSADSALQLLQNSLHCSGAIMDLLAKAEVAGNESAWQFDTMTRKQDAVLVFSAAISATITLTGAALRTLGTTGAISEEAAKATVTVLCRAFVLKQYDVVAACAQTAVVLGTQSYSAFPPAYNGVLTNALLRRIDAPTSSREYESKEGASLNISTDASALLMARCMDAIVDLHSSDDENLLQNYHKLQVGSKLTQALSDIEKHLEYVNGTQDKEFIQNILENTAEFVKYKRNFVP
jgi:hypothetical protein